MKINKIIIWGHPLHSHTHSYIHNGFFIAFKDYRLLIDYILPGKDIHVVDGELFWILILVL